MHTKPAWLTPAGERAANAVCRPGERKPGRNGRPLMAIRFPGTAMPPLSHRTNCRRSPKSARQSEAADGPGRSRGGRDRSGNIGGTMALPPPHHRRPGRCRGRVHRGGARRGRHAVAVEFRHAGGGPLQPGRLAARGGSQPDHCRMPHPGAAVPRAGRAAARQGHRAGGSRSGLPVRSAHAAAGAGSRAAAWPNAPGRLGVVGGAAGRDRSAASGCPLARAEGRPASSRRTTG